MFLIALIIHFGLGMQHTFTKDNAMNVFGKTVVNVIGISVGQIMIINLALFWEELALGKEIRIIII